MQTEKSKPSSQRKMSETRQTSFLALIIYPRVEISRSASETDVRFILSRLTVFHCRTEAKLHNNYQIVFIYQLLTVQSHKTENKFYVCKILKLFQLEMQSGQIVNIQIRCLIKINGCAISTCFQFWCTRLNIVGLKISRAVIG